MSYQEHDEVLDRYNQILLQHNMPVFETPNARKLRNATNLPLYYLDMLWHKEEKTNISREEFDIKLISLSVKSNEKVTIIKKGDKIGQFRLIERMNEEIKFNYDKKNKLLVSIIDNKGKLIRYFYNGDNLQYIVEPVE